MDLREHPHAGPRRHPWEVARAAFFRDVLREGGGLDRVRTVLDVGAGDAWLARTLRDGCAPAARLVCWDAHYDDAWLARSDEGCTFTREAPEMPADLVLALDVAEHVDDDRAFLRDVAARVAPGGRLLFSVPAWPWLFSGHDVALGHHRRYTPAAARALLEGAGLRIDRSGGLFHSLLLPRAAQRLVQRLRPVLDAPAATSLAWSGGAALSAALGAALHLDNRVSRLAAARAIPLPGLSWWALCHPTP